MIGPVWDDSKTLDDSTPYKSHHTENRLYNKRHNDLVQRRDRRSGSRRLKTFLFGYTCPRWVPVEATVGLRGGRGLCMCPVTEEQPTLTVGDLKRL